MAMNEAQLNSACLHRAWEEIKRREAILMRINNFELNYACLQQAETESVCIR